MSLASWLRAVADSIRRPAPNLAPIAAPSPDTVGKTPASPDYSASDDVRMHIAAHDPAFPAKRETAVAAITAAIDRVAQAHGFTKKPKSWAKTGPFGTVSLHLQRSRYGFDCRINLGFQPMDGVLHGPWALDDLIPLGRFYPPGVSSSDVAGTLVYLDVLEQADSLDHPIAILTNHALPWLLAHLTQADAPNRPLQ